MAFPKTISCTKHAALVFSVYELESILHTQINKKAIHVIDDNIPSNTVPGQNVDDIDGCPIGPLFQIVRSLSILLIVLLN